jgi:heme O synthase-like polyprenyltransferase
MPSLRTLLVLGRTSNLPTVWSNCLAGWWLGGRGNPWKLILLMLGATLLYVGGMYLNDAFDAKFDAQHRRERPIPSGLITVELVWRIGVGSLMAGLVILFCLGLSTGLIGVVLVGCIVFYDAIHKVITLSPLVMAACRFFLYPMAASIAANGVTGWSVWCGLALAFYIVGLSFIARKESTRAAAAYWPCLALVVPIVLALVMNTGVYRESALILAALLGLWMARSLRFAYRAMDRNIGRAISGLLAGIVFVDLLAVADAPNFIELIFLGLLGAALVFQRFVPAT